MLAEKMDLNLDPVPVCVLALRCEYVARCGAQVGHDMRRIFGELLEMSAAEIDALKRDKVT